MSKPFIALIIAVLVIGLSIGGAFAGGIAIGKSQDSDSPPSIQTASTGPASTQATDGALTAEQLQELRQRIQSGDVIPGELGQFGQQFPGGFGGRGGGGAGGFGFGGGGLFGTIEAIEGGEISVNTAQGVLKASVSSDTNIQVFSEGTLQDLLNGMQVTVVGERDEEGNVQATSIVVVPEGGGGFRFGGQRQAPNQ